MTTRTASGLYPETGIDLCRACACRPVPLSGLKMWTKHLLELETSGAKCNGLETQVSVFRGVTKLPRFLSSWVHSHDSTCEFILEGNKCELHEQGTQQFEAVSSRGDKWCMTVPSLASTQVVGFYWFTITMYKASPTGFLFS